MEGAVNYVTQDTGAKTTNSAEHSTWTIRKIIILATIFLVFFVVFAAFSVYAPFFPSEARNKGVSSTVVGLIFGTYAFVVFLTSPLFGVLIPWYGARFVLFTGIFLCGGSLVLFGFCGMLTDRNTFIVFCFLIRTTSAIGGGASETSAMTIIMETFPNNLGTVTGAVETFSGIGFSLGPALGGFLYTAGGFILPFIVMGSAMIAAMPVVFFVLYEKENKNNEETAEQSTSMFKALRIPGVFVLALTYVIIGCSFGFIDPIFSPQMKLLGESPSHIGLMFLFYSGVYALSSPGIGWIGDKTKCYRGFLILGFTGFGVGYLLLGPASFLTFLPRKKLWLVYIALSVCGLSGGFSFVPIMPDLIRTARKNGMEDNSSTNAVLSSIFGSMYYLGAFIGPSIAGISAEHLGYEWSTSLAGFICFGHALLLSFFTLFEFVFQRNKNNSDISEEERRPLLHESV